MLLKTHLNVSGCRSVRQCLLCPCQSLLVEQGGLMPIGIPQQGMALVE